jgi:hypothetical protein
LSPFYATITDKQTNRGLNIAKLSMKLKQLFEVFIILLLLLFASMSHAASITATNSGLWGTANVWDSGTVPGINDVVFIAAGVNVTVNTNAAAQSISDDTTGGTLTMGPNSTLTIAGNDATHQLSTLDTSAAGNTVMYVGNPFFAKQCNYYNLVFANTNYVDPLPPYSGYQNFNNFSSSQGPTPMAIAGNMTLLGHTKVQQGSGGASITINGSLTIGKGCAWDSSGDILTVASNTYVYGALEDLNGALGANHFGGDVVVAGPSTSVPAYVGGPYTNGWFVSDVITWGIGGNLTNNGSIFGAGYGSISFEGTGTIAGTNALNIPTLTVNGTYTIGTQVTLTTNTPTLHGTLVFDIAHLHQLTLASNIGTLYYDGQLNVINTGGAPSSGASFQLFNAAGYNGFFLSTTFPGLPAGLSWEDNTLVTGSIDVTGTSTGSPTLTLSRSGNLLTLSWDSTTFPGFSVQGQTNSGGIGTNWGPTGSGAVSPFTIAIDPKKSSVFFRLSNP